MKNKLNATRQTRRLGIDANMFVLLVSLLGNEQRGLFENQREYVFELFCLFWRLSTVPQHLYIEPSMESHSSIYRLDHSSLSYQDHCIPRSVLKLSGVLEWVHGLPEKKLEGIFSGGFGGGRRQDPLNTRWSRGSTKEIRCSFWCIGVQLHFQGAWPNSISLIFHVFQVCSSVETRRR